MFHSRYLVYFDIDFIAENWSKSILDSPAPISILHACIYLLSIDLNSRQVYSLYP